MSSTPPPASTPPESAQSQYGVLAACSLALVALALMQLGLSLLMGLLTVLVGLIGIMIRWRVAAPLQLVVLAVVLVLSRPAPPFFQNGGVVELLLAASTLCYCVSQYRLLGLSVAIFPREPRPRGGPKHKWRTRPARLVQSREIALLLMALPVCVLLAQYLWRDLDESQLHWQVQNPGFAEPFWDLVILAWTIGVVLMLVHAAFGWWTSRRMSPEEARLLLQETVWNETRREQRYINRWLVWSRRRRERKEDKA